MSTDPRWLTRAQARGWLPDGWKHEYDPEPSALLAALVLLGALVCSVPFLAFLGLGLDEFLLRTAGGYVLGLLAFGAAIWWLRRRRHIFATCMALELWVLGVVLLLIRWLQDSSGGAGAYFAASLFTTAALLGSALVIPARWVGRLMGFALAPAALAALAFALAWIGAPEEAIFALLPIFLLMGVVVWAWWCWYQARWLGRPGAARGAALADGFAIGLLVSALWLGTWVHMPWRGMQAHENDASWYWLDLVSQWLAVFLVACSVWMLSRRWSTALDPAESPPAHESPLSTDSTWRPLLWLTGAVLAFGAWFNPVLGSVAVVAAMAAVSAYWRLLATAGLVALGLLSSFYYSLAWPLTTKGVGLGVIGAAIAAGLLILRTRGSREADLQPEGSRRGAAWVLLGGVIALAATNADVWRKVNIIAEGQRILVELAPVDPRSLMQGDYMQLRFSIPAKVEKLLNESTVRQLSKRALVVAKLNERGEAELLRLAAQAEAVPRGEILLPMKQLKGNWVLVTDAYFFPEGEGHRFENAKFGEFRALPDGRALLVGLADEQGQPID